MRVPEIVKNIIIILGAITFFGLLFTFIVMESRFTKKWKAEVKYTDGTTATYIHWTLQNSRPEPENGVWILRLNSKERNHYVAIPRDAKVEFTAIDNNLQAK